MNRQFTGNAGARRGEVFTTGEVAKMFRVAPRTVSMWCDGEKLKNTYRMPPGKKLSHGHPQGDKGDRRIPLESLITFCREHKVPMPRELLDIMGDTVHLSFGVTDDERNPLTKDCPNPFVLMELIASTGFDKIKTALIGDTQGMDIAYGAIRAIRNRNPGCACLLFHSYDVSIPADIAENTRGFLRPVDPKLVTQYLLERTNSHGFDSQNR